MARCPTCNSEVVDSLMSCPSCGASVEARTGTVATVAMEVPAASNGSKSTPSRSSRLLESSIPDEGRFPPGTLVNGRYRIVGLLGRGGMGEVYRATDLTLAQAVALKFLPETGVSERVLERFHAEVRIARQISHPNVCRVYDIGEVDGQPFISMEYVDGEDLADLLQRIGRLPADKATETARKICAGLAAAHDKGVIHRDLKPQNIMLNKRGEPVIMDFGLAAVADQLTGAEARNGTPAYMAPEQLRGDEVTAKSDIYALGLVLYEIYSGKRAYEAQTIGDLLKLQEGAQVTSLTTLAADVDPQVEKVVKRCLNPNPALRPATPLAVGAALPGGDPLAAALAAGETPSPELVAASGTNEGMDLRFSVPLLVFILAVVIGLPFWTASHSVMELMPGAYSPTVARHEARKFAASFGYTQAPRDSHIGETFSNTRSYWISHDRKGKSWSDVVSAEAFRTYYYRESPSLLASNPKGRVNANRPAPTTSGMIQIELTFTGQLRKFEAIPAEKPSGTAGAPFEEDALFKAVGYNRETFTETTPETIPLVMADLRKAWKGPVPGLPDVEVRVEAGSLAGRITAVKVIFPWTTPDRQPSDGNTGASMWLQLVRTGFYGLVSLFVVIYAVRNLRLNRSDRKGAFRLATAMAFLDLVTWLGQAHHVPSIDEWNFIINAASEALMSAAIAWMLYVALEPAVRSRWPKSQVSWNRLLEGRFGDPQVGMHMLVGAALGLVFLFGFVYVEMLDKGLVGVPANSNLEESFGTGVWLGNKADTLEAATYYGFFLFFGIFFFRMALRNDYAAALAAAVVYALIDNPGMWNAPNPWMRVGLLVLLFGVMGLALLRMGVIVSIMSTFFVNSMYRLSVDIHASAWYTPYGLATMAVLCSIAVFAFWRSMGSRNLSEE